jgi:hypothetical protein
MKKLSEQQIIGQRGVHLLGERLLSVGLSFHANGPLDAGIDGFLELRDPVSGEVRAQYVLAQLKTQKEGNFLRRDRRELQLHLQIQGSRLLARGERTSCSLRSQAERPDDLLEVHSWLVRRSGASADPQGRLRQDQGLAERGGAPGNRLDCGELRHARQDSPFDPK